MQYFAHSDRYSVVQINFSMLTTALYPLVRTTLVYNDKKYSVSIRLYLFIYLFILSNGRYVHSVIHPFDPLPLSIFGFQMLNRKQCISADGSGPSLLFDYRLCREDGEIIFRYTDVWQGSHVQEVGEICNGLTFWPPRWNSNWVLPRFL
jgi:hypothetical protein